MRLIDADALPRYTGMALSADEVARAVENAPTIDAEPVVRCKDCWYRNGTSGQPDIPCLQMHEDDWFCADGERREGEA